MVVSARRWELRVATGTSSLVGRYTSDEKDRERERERDDTNDTIMMAMAVVWLVGVGELAHASVGCGRAYVNRIESNRIER